MCTSRLIHSEAASFEEGARARLATSPNSTRSVAAVSRGRPRPVDARLVRIFAMPSRNEGFGLVYIEAMSHGVPCIASTEDAAGEVIDDGRTGFLVVPDDRD